MKYRRNLILLSGFMLLWQGCIIAFALPPFILPSPLAVGQTLLEQATLLANHGLITLVEIIGGLLVGTLLGISIALAMTYNRTLKYWLQPLLVVSQSIPTFAIAPILIFWLGYGIESKLIITAFMIFFPITSNFFDGLQHTPIAYVDLAKTINANPRQILWHIRIPAALPALASGMRIATAIAPIGAIIGEWVGASHGLGFLMLEAHARLQIDLVFAILVIIIIFSLSFYAMVDRLLQRLIPWQIH